MPGAPGKSGGKRGGSGRPNGARNALPYGGKQAIDACRFRVPDDASDEQIMLADRSLQRIVDCMEGRVFPEMLTGILKAATWVRTEACGPMAQKVEHSGPNGGELKVSIEINRTVRPHEGKPNDTARGGDGGT